MQNMYFRGVSCENISCGSWRHHGGRGQIAIGLEARDGWKRAAQNVALSRQGRAGVIGTWQGRVRECRDSVRAGRDMALVEMKGGQNRKSSMQNEQSGAGPGQAKVERDSSR